MLGARDNRYTTESMLLMQHSNKMVVNSETKKFYSCGELEKQNSMNSMGGHFTL